MPNSKTTSPWIKRGAALGLLPALLAGGFSAQAATAPDIAKPVVSVVTGGTTVISQPLPLEQVGIAIAVKHTGSAFETPYDGGLAAAAFSAANAQLKERLGATGPLTTVMDGVSGRDFWMFEISGRQADWKTLLDTALKTLAAPDFTHAGTTHSPCDSTSPENLYYLNAYRTSPLRYPSCGLEPGKTPDPAAMKDYVARHFVSSNLVIALSGNVAVQDVLDFLMSEKAIPVSGSDSTPAGGLAEPGFSGPREFEVPGGSGQCLWVGGFRLDGEGAFPAPFQIVRKVLMDRIRNDFSRFGFQNENLDVALDEFEGTSPTFRMTLACTESGKTAALQLVFHALEQLQGGGLEEAELEAARNEAEGELRQPFVTPATAAPVLARDFIVTGDAGHSLQLIARLLEMTGRDVQSSAQDLSEGRLTVVETATAAALGQAPAPVRSQLLRRQLNNGMRIALQKQAAAGLVEFRLSALGGLRGEPAGEEGLSALAAEALFAGTPSFSADQIRQKLDALGADRSAFEEEEVSGVRIRVPAERARDALTLLADLTQNSILPTPAMPSVQSAAATDLQNYGDSLLPAWGGVTSHRGLPDFGLVSVLLSGQSPAGSLPDLRNRYRSIPREDILLFFRRHFTPTNLVLTAAGDLDLDATAQSIDSLFGKMTGTGTRYPPAAGLVASSWTADASSADRAGVVVAFPAVAYSHKDRLPVELLVDFWWMRIDEFRKTAANPPSGTPGRDLSPGLYFGTDTGIVTLPQPSPAADSAVPTGATSTSSGGGMTTPKDAATLDRVKDLALSSFLLRSADLTFTTRLLTLDSLYGTDDATLYRQRLAAVTLDDVKRVATTYFDRTPTVITLTSGGAKP